MEVAGTAGWAEFTDGRLRHQSDHVPGADGNTPWSALPNALLDLYLDALTGAPDVPLVTVWEAADSVAVIEAMYAAADRGTWLTPTRQGPIQPPSSPFLGRHDR